MKTEDPKPAEPKGAAVNPRIVQEDAASPIELPPTTADLVRQLREFRDLTSREISEIKGRIEAMTPKEKIAVEAKLEGHVEKKSKASANWLYDLFWS
jgi:hypothetical protein